MMINGEKSETELAKMLKFKVQKGVEQTCRRWFRRSRQAQIQYFVLERKHGLK